MSLLGGVAAASGAVGAIGALANALFPDQVLIEIPDQNIQINIDAATNISVNTSVAVSDHATETLDVLVQNVSPNPKSITLACTFSSIIRLSNINTAGAAASFGIAAAIPEASALSDILANEEDSIVTRLEQLRTAQRKGQIVQIIGLTEHDGVDFIISDISDDETTETGTKSRTVNITIRDAFIAGADTAADDEDKSIFSKIFDLVPGNPINSPSGVGGLA